MIAFRPAVLRNADGSPGRDRQFVIESWVDSYRDAYTAGLIAMERWKPVMRVEVGSILDRPAQVIVAHDPDDPDPIADLYGFIAYDASFSVPYVYYVYVKQNYREGGYSNGRRVGDGIGRRLFAAAGINPSNRFVYAASTRVTRILQDKAPLARWNPLPARFSYDEAKHYDAEHGIYRNREDRSEGRRRWRAG